MSTPRTLERLREISSPHNALVKELRRAFARAEATEDGYIAVEGVHMLEEAIRSGLRLKAVFFSRSAQARAPRLLPQLGAAVETVMVSDEVFASATDTETPQGVAALVKLKTHTLEELLRAPATSLFALICVGLQDPGNLGTIIRSAEAFGASFVVASDGTVSRFNSKAVRAAAGSLFRLPVVQNKAADAIGQLRAVGARLFATSSHSGKPLPETDLTGRVAVFVGSEGAGLRHELTKQMDDVITIPHSAQVESLNAAMAASVVMYEAERQKDFSPQRH